MKIGWQEWDAIVFAPSVVSNNQSAAPNAPAKGEDKSTDWWNVEDNTSFDQGTSTLPLDEWLPLQVHDAGISEITMTKCFVDHAYGFCYPDTTPEEDR
ncbi:hypothetical protein FRC19_007254 [Serendipita sp. 401]|nr:hypothetical protein FRC19_007254 [Serendipita sp. 401]